MHYQSVSDKELLHKYSSLKSLIKSLVEIFNKSCMDYEAKISIGRMIQNSSFKLTIITLEIEARFKEAGLENQLNSILNFNHK